MSDKSFKITITASEPIRQDGGPLTVLGVESEGLVSQGVDPLKETVTTAVFTAAVIMKQRMTEVECPPESMKQIYMDYVESIWDQLPEDLIRGQSIPFSGPEAEA